MSEAHDESAEIFSDAAAACLERFTQNVAASLANLPSGCDDADYQPCNESRPTPGPTDTAPDRHNAKGKTIGVRPGLKHIGEPRHENISKEIGSREITIARGADKNARVWKNVTGTFQQLFDGYLSKHRVGQKDGQAITQGKLSGPARTSNNMWLNYLVMIDIDNGTPLEEIEQILRDSGLFGIIYTTHSHLKPQTTIKEKGFDDWVKTQPDLGDATDVEKATRYLAKVKKYAPAILESIHEVNVAMLDGGRQYVVEHAPMHRARVVFILDEVFDFANRGKQHEAIAEWKATYTNFCNRLGVAFDGTCIDPARLMYTPCRGTDSNPDDHKVIVVEGEPLTIERMKEGGPARVEADPLTNFAGPDANKKTFVTPNLRRFLAEYSYTFQAADWLEAVDAGGHRGHRSSGSGIHFQCPNEDNHSEITPNDKAFFATNGGEGGGDGFMLHCMHTTCKTMSDGDRAWFLDMACQKYGIKDAMELRAYCVGAGQEQAAVEARGEAIIAEGSLDARIEAVTPETDVAVITDILSALAQKTPSLQIDAQIEKIITQRGGRGRGSIKAEYRRWRAALIAAAATDVAPPAVAREPEDVENYRGPVMAHWHETTQNFVARNVLIDSNAKEPGLFARPDGSVARCTPSKLGVKLETVRTMNEWESVLYDHVTFQRVDERAGDLININPPAKITAYFSGRRDAPFPIIKSIVRVPVLGPDGTLRWEKGYDASTQTYLDPSTEFLPVDDTITPEMVSEAKWWVAEAIRDFPFSDGFNGKDNQEIYTDVVDADGFREPNWDRGRASRIHAIAMMIQPVVRPVIVGPTPVYHIDKPVPGTGASLLMDLIYGIHDGALATTQTLANNEEEVRKMISATVAGCPQTFFIDNINRRVDSGYIAAVITAGIWSDRELGTSNIRTTPISMMFVMAGNNLSFSEELMRRNVPCRLDASTPHPAKDRIDKKSFKHFPLHPWVLKNRAKLIWAIHVLVLNWVKNYGMKWGQKRLNSFDSWAGVMGGIFEAADMEGFLDNVSDYLSDTDDDTNVDERFGKLMIERFTEDPMRHADIQAVLENPLSDVTMDDLGIMAPTPGGRSRELGKYLSKMCKGRTYQPDPADPSVRYKLAKRILGGYAIYQFTKLP